MTVHVYTVYMTFVLYNAINGALRRTKRDRHLIFADYPPKKSFRFTCQTRPRARTIDSRAPHGCFAAATRQDGGKSESTKISTLPMCAADANLAPTHVHAKSSLLQIWVEQVNVCGNDDLFRERMWLFSSQHFTRHALPPSLLIRVSATE